VSDVLADAMLVLAGTFDPSRGSLAAWFLFLAHQQAVAVIRSRRTRREARQLDGVPEPADPAPHGVDQLLAEERLAHVREALAVLSDLERSVIEADLGAQRVVAAEQLAVQLNTTAGSVYSARRRARRKLLKRCGWLREVAEEKRDDHDEAT
jgi:RNA polymerase sigma factor (sigma-70 family)